MWLQFKREETFYCREHDSYAGRSADFNKPECGLDCTWEPAGWEFRIHFDLRWHPSLFWGGRWFPHHNHEWLCLDCDETVRGRHYCGG